MIQKEIKYSLHYGDVRFLRPPHGTKWLKSYKLCLKMYTYVFTVDNRETNEYTLCRHVKVIIT